MFKISPTKLQTFLDCPRKYYYVYVKGLREPMRSALACGQVVHNTIDGFFSVRPDLRTPQRIQQIFSTYWQAVQGGKGGFVSDSEEQEALAKTSRILDTFLAITDRQAQPFHHRQRLIEAPVGPNLIFQGKIDRIDEFDDELHLIDYKTGSDEYQNEWQLPIYIAMIEHKFARPVASSSLWFLDHRKTIHIDPTQHPSKQTLDRVREVVNTIPRDLDIRSFPCPNGTCQYCEWATQA